MSDRPLRWLRFDSTGGASGDMILGALIDLGVDASRLATELAGLDIGRFELRAEQVRVDGFAGLRVTVVVPDEQHHHRHLADITERINSSGLPTAAREMSVGVFRRLADAEARVHGTTPDKIHFHEVGAVDSIVDVVGACCAVHELNVDGIVVSPLPLGHGTVTCEHGTMPVPVPAVVELLKGFPVTQTDEPHELVTPTGAALLTTLKTHARVPPGATLSTAGSGFGHRRLDTRPNVLRATVFESDATQPACRDDCLVLECNVDDMVPELVGSLCNRLLEGGALDVFTTAVYMKKQRPGSLITILCAPADRQALTDIVFAESTTFGIRTYAVDRTVLERRMDEVETPFGRVRVKSGSSNGRVITRSPEHDDCVALAEQHGVAVRQVYEAALAAALAASV